MDNANIFGGVAGGALIGLAAVLLLLLNGRIAGISGILAGAISMTPAAERFWRAAFVGGLVIGAAAYSLIFHPLQLQMATSTPTLVLAGILVGFGTRLGSGCTSGHGVCGLARRSPRSLVATMTFIGFGILTVYLVRHTFS